MNDEEDESLVKNPLESEEGEEQSDLGGDKLDLGSEEGEDIENTDELGDEVEVGDVVDDEETSKDGEVEVEDATIKPKKGPSVFLVKKKVNESKIFKLKKNNKGINEHQIGDTVTFNKDKGYIIGQTNDGDFLVQVQGSSSKVNPSKLKAVGKKVDAMKPQYEFDKVTQQNLTTKSLFEQYVKCGVYMNNTPIKLNDCYVKFSEWNNSTDEQPIAILIEGSNSIMPKKQIRILENINDFANPDNYTEGVIIDEATGEAIENILVNIIDYTQAIGDSDEIRIVKQVGGEHIVSSAPLSIIKTLTI